MKKALLKILLVLTACVCALAAVACAAVPTVASVSFEFAPETEYVRNEEIDYSGLKVTVNYDDGSKKTYTATDEEVTITGGETDEAGAEFTLTVSCEGESKTYAYSVRNTRLTLIFGDGEYEGAADGVLTAETPENYTDITDYEPVPNEFGMAFAGWFYDQAFTKPVKYVFDNKVSTSEDTTLYAGYDVDYSTVFNYERNSAGDEITLVSFNAFTYYMGAMEIPETIELLPVTVIADDFFPNSDSGMGVFFDTLDFGKHSKVREIGVNAFSGASFETIVLSENLERIGAGAFMGNAVKQIAFPETLEYIGEEAFYACGDLAEINFAENSDLQVISTRAFGLCDAFGSIVLPESVTEIGDYAFEICEGLTGVRIGKKVAKIGLHSFTGCSFLKEIVVDPQNADYSTVNSDLYTKNGKGLVRYCFGKREKKFTVPSTVTDILECAFDAYNLNSYLEEIVLPDKLETIGADAFRSCDAKFVIPASVKSIANRAFADSLISEFAISPENEYFAVVDGVLYSKDLKTLIAVPNNLESETFTLRPEVETIREGALYKNKTVKYVVIPANSNLTYIENGGFVPGNCSKLCGIYIEKTTPFSVAEGAFAGERSLLNENFSFYVSDELYSAYKQAWGNLYLTGTDPITPVQVEDKLVAAAALPKTTLDQIFAQINYSDETPSVENMLAALKRHIDSNTTTSYATFESMIQILNGAFYSGVSLEPAYDYLLAFERTMFETLTEVYEDYSDKQIGTYGSFYNVSTHYDLLPAAIQAELSDYSSRFAAILKRTDEISEIQKNNKAEVLAIVNDMAHFDADRAYRAYRTYKDYGEWALYGCKWGDTLDAFRLHCSYLISEFLTTEFKAENLADIRIYLEGNSFDYDNMETGIDSYLGSFFASDAAKQSLYRYDDYAARRAEYEAYIQGINDAVANYDLSEFDYETAGKAISDYNALTAWEQTFDAQVAYVALSARYSMVTFGKGTVTAENYADRAYEYIAVARVMDNLDDLFEYCQATAAEIAAFNANKTVLMSVFETNAKDLLAAVKALTQENFKEKCEDVYTLYFTLDTADSALACYYEYAFTSSFNEEITTTLDAYCATVLKGRLINRIVEQYTEINKDNYAEFNNNMVNGERGLGFFEGKEDVSVISITADGEEVHAKDRVEQLYMSNDIILAYNELIEQYIAIRNSFWSNGFGF